MLRYLQPGGLIMLGLALCGGGMKCASHLGVMRVMDDLNIRPSLLAGSSMGAVMGAVYASGMGVRDAIEQLYRVRMSDLYVGGVPLPGLNHAPRFRASLKRLFGSRMIEELSTKLIVTTCDMVTGRPIWLTNGSLADALYASCAFPGLFPPLRQGERLLADGCLADPLPVETLREHGATRVIGIHFGITPALDHRRVWGAAHRSISILLDGLSGAACRSLDLLIQPPVAHMSALQWNRTKMEQCVEAGRESAERMKDELIQMACESMPPRVPVSSALTDPSPAGC